MTKPRALLLGLLVLNAIIIVATQANDRLFRDTGLIHGIAILFVILALTRIPVLWKPYREPAGKFVRWMLVALLVFAGSHALEYIGFRLNGGRYSAVLYANVANAYIISLLGIIIGLEYILRTFYARSRWFLRIPGLILLITSIVLVGFVFQGESVSLSPESFLPYLYTVIIMALGIFGFVNILEVKRLQPKLKAFARHMKFVLGLVIIAALINVLYQLMYVFLGVDRTQLIYIAHYSFYLGISVMYLAFGEPVRSLAEQSTQERI